MAEIKSEIARVLENPRFVGLWTYRELGRTRKFSASVMADGYVMETKLCSSWLAALRLAQKILEK